MLTVRGTGNSTSTPTTTGGTQKRTKASASVRPNKRTKTNTTNRNIESGSDQDQDFDREEARGVNSGNDTEEEGGYEQMREDADRDHKVLFQLFGLTSFILSQLDTSRAFGATTVVPTINAQRTCA
jgi:hypothetical protein